MKLGIDGLCTQWLKWPGQVGGGAQVTEAIDGLGNLAHSMHKNTFSLTEGG